MGRGTDISVMRNCFVTSTKLQIHDKLSLFDCELATQVFKWTQQQVEVRW